MRSHDNYALALDISAAILDTGETQQSVLHRPRRERHDDSIGLAANDRVACPFKNWTHSKHHVIRMSFRGAFRKYLLLWLPESRSLKLWIV